MKSLSITRCTCGKHTLATLGTRFSCECGKIQTAEAAKDICPMLEDGKCQLASLVSGEPIQAIKSVCTECLNSSRPRRLNEYNLCLIPEPKVSEAALAMSAEEGAGSDLEKLFGVFAKADASCGCEGVKDILNTWTLERINGSIDAVVAIIAREASRRQIPHCKLAIKAAIKAVLIKRKILSQG